MWEYFRHVFESSSPRVFRRFNWTSRQAMTTKKCERGDELFGSATHRVSQPLCQSERARRRLLLMGHDTATSSSHSGGKFANCRQTTTTTTAIRMCTGNWRNPWNLPNNFFRQIYWVSRTTFYMSSIAHTFREMMAVELLPHICPLQNILLHIFASNFWRVSFWWSTTFSSSAGRTYFHTRQVVRSKWPPLI